MAFRLSHEQKAMCARHRAALDAQRKRVTARFDEFTRTINALEFKVKDAIDQYNAEAERARAFTDMIASEFKDDWDDRSERWQESDVGQAALSFVEDWLNAYIPDLDRIEVVFPDEPDFGQCRLEDLPDEADS